MIIVTKNDNNDIDGGTNNNMTHNAQNNNINNNKNRNIHNSNNKVKIKRNMLIKPVMIIKKSS